MERIALDSHKRYSLLSAEDEQGLILREGRVPHKRGAIRGALEGFTPGSPVAVETIGNWYWIVDEIEQAGLVPRLVHARKAKLMSGQINKTDKLDVRGLNKLQRAGTLPEVWIPPAELRDKRDLSRARMSLSNHRTRYKNWIHPTLAKYALQDFEELSDIFGVKGRKLVKERMGKLPTHTRYTMERFLESLDQVQTEIDRIETRMKEVFEQTQEVKLLQTIFGVGFILAVVISLEVGDVKRFPSSACLASYAGTTPRIHASGGRVRYGQTRPDVNRYLKWAFCEAATTVASHRKRRPHMHASRLYDRIRARKGHPKAIGAVARHLAEATYWMLTNNEPYREPKSKATSSRRV